MYLKREQVATALLGIPGGTAGTIATLRGMEAFAVSGGLDPMVRGQAIAIVRGVQPHDFAGEIRALFEWVRDHIRFTRGPQGVTQSLQTADRTLRWRAGHCADTSILLAALLRAIGHPAQLAFRTIGVPGSGEDFRHVYVVTRLGSQEIPLDPTYPDTPAGWQYPLATRTMDRPLWAT